MHLRILTAMDTIRRKLAKPQYLFCILVFINLFNYIDRGIIPGSSTEFDQFITDTLHTDKPDIYLGLLQSSFIVGFAISSIFFAHLVHYYPPFYLCGIGLAIWIVAVFSSGLAYYVDSYPFLIIARMLSGVGEGSFQCSVPPWITIFASKGYQATWISIFYTAIPVGTAVGYTYSSFMSSSLGWQYAFFLESLIMTPLVCILFLVSSEYPVSSILASDVDHSADKPSILDEFKVIIQCPIFLLQVAGYAAQCASLIGLSTFGSMFFMNLGYFSSESEASTIFGGLVCIAGILGTPIGGFLLDRISSSKTNNAFAAASTGNNTEYNPKHSTNAASFLLDDSYNISDRTEDVSLLHPSSQATHRRKKKKYINDVDIEVLLADNQIMTISSLLGLLAMISVYFLHAKSLFLLSIFIGCFFIFLATSGINLGIMLSVPVENRSFAIAVSSVCIHMFGDVPSPVIAGYLLDYLAPDCSSSSSSSGDDDKCKGDADGIRLTMLLLSVWLAWTVVFFGYAWRMSSLEARSRRKSILDELLLNIDGDRYSDNKALWL